MVFENRKLIYQVSRIQGGYPTVYLKQPFDDEGVRANIWIKRAYKKGYVDLVHEDTNHYEYQINEQGVQLLKDNPEFYGLQYKYRSYNKKHTKDIDGIDAVKERRRERRRLRKLKKEGKL